MNRYYVDKDLQGDYFGMNRDYTALQWLEQAQEWADMEENYELFNEIENMKQKFEQNVLNYIGTLWAIRFRKVRHDKKIDKYDLSAYDYKIKGE